MLNTFKNKKRVLTSLLGIWLLISCVYKGQSQDFQTLPQLLLAKQIYEKAAYDSVLTLLTACKPQKKTDQAFKTKLLAHNYYSQNNWPACIQTLSNWPNTNKDQELIWLLCQSLAQNKQADEALMQLLKYKKMRYSLASPKQIQNDSALLNIANTKAWDDFWQKNEFSDYENLYDDASYEYRFARTENAIHILSDILSRKKHLPSLLLFAQIEWDQNHTKSAISAAEQAYITGNKNPLVCEVYIEYLLLDKNKKLARSLLNKHLIEFPYHLEFYRQMAILHRMQNEYDKADAYLNYYKTWLPASLDNWEKLGQLYYKNDDNLEALRYFSRCIAQKPLAKYYRQRGLCYFSSNSYKYALTDLAMTIDINPRDAQAWFLQGEIFLREGDRISACSKWKRATQLGSHEALIQYNKYCEGE